jgi:peroxiredoxin
MYQDQTRQSIAEGARAPDFELQGVDGTTFRSSELLQRGPVLLTFYRGAWCGCCQADLRDVVRMLPRLQEGNLTVLGVFHEMSREAAQRVASEYGLEFPLVNDIDGRVAEAFGIRRTAVEFAQIREEIGPEALALKGGEPWILPMQARFLIGTDGVVARTEIATNYEERCELSELVPVLERMG